MILPDGGNYVGESKNGEPNGQGTMTLSDGGNYVGEFKDGKPNGQGTMPYLMGQSIQGNGRVENLMGKEQKSPLMEVSL